jgi:undecaprenyl-diphosphatase
MTHMPHPKLFAGIALVTCVLAAAISTFIAFDAAPIQGDTWTMHRIQDASALRPFASTISNIGDVRWIPFVIALGFATARHFTLKDAGHGPIIFGVIALAMILIWPLNHQMKDLLDSPRPQDFSGFYVDHLRSDNGFPSGHVYADVLFFGVLAAFAPTYVPKRAVLPVQAACVAIIVLSGPSRMIVGAHWPSDVLGGYLWGATALCITLCLAHLTPRAPVNPESEDRVHDHGLLPRRSDRDQIHRALQQLFDPLDERPRLRRQVVECAHVRRRCLPARQLLVHRPHPV